jgi:hypothetical protein
MILRTQIGPYAVLLLFVASCKVNKSIRPVAESYLPDPASVGFDIEPIRGESKRWIATYKSQGKIAKFRIELGAATVSSAKEAKDFDLKFGEGMFVAEEGSDASVFLKDLQKAIEAKTLPTATARSPSVRFTFASLGENLSQISGGGFHTKPPGGWICMKIFLGEGDQEGEVFLNLNSAIRKGQFSMKDSNYGDLVLGELAKVL